MQQRIFEVLLCYGRLSLPAIIHYTHLSNRLVKHGLSVLVQQHLVFWNTASNDHLTLYEANTAVAYSLVRSGKYIKVAETQAGEFAGKVISNLLLLGHARVRDLVQAYRVGQAKSTHVCPVPTPGPPGKFLSKSFGHAEESIDEPNAPYESIHETLRGLLRAGLVSRVHVSHFRSDADNRSEAEKEVPEPEEYKTKGKKGQEALREAAVRQKLKEWKYCTDAGDDEVDGLRGEKKRPHEDNESQRPGKRQRIDSPVSRDVSGAGRQGYHPMLGLPDDLDVRDNEIPQCGLEN